MSDVVIAITFACVGFVVGYLFHSWLVDRNQ